MRIRVSQLLAFVCLSSAPLSFAHAVLGEDVSTVHKSAKATQSKLAPATAPFSVHEVEIDGVKIREYVGADNRVFAVTWRGIREPVDLEGLLGNFYRDFSGAESKASRPPGPPSFRSPSEVKGNRITVIRSGHQRDIRGVAYLTNQLPTGVRPEDLE